MKGLQESSQRRNEVWLGDGVTDLKSRGRAGGGSVKDGQRFSSGATRTDVIMNEGRHRSGVFDTKLEGLNGCAEEAARRC